MENIFLQILLPTITGFIGYAISHYSSSNKIEDLTNAYNDSQLKLSKAVTDLHRAEGEKFNAKIDRDEWEVKYREAMEENESIQKEIDPRPTPINKRWRVVYFNIFDGFAMPRSRTEADILANEMMPVQRSECVRVLYQEGQFDE